MLHHINRQILFDKRPSGIPNEASSSIGCVRNASGNRGQVLEQTEFLHSALMKGFIVRNYAIRFEEGIRQLAGWLKEGKLKYAETIAEKFESAPKTLIRLFAGENLGKQLVRVWHKVD